MTVSTTTAPDHAGARPRLLGRPPVWLFAILLAASTPSVLIMLLIAVGSTARGALLSAAVLAGFAAIVLLVIRRSGSSLPPRSFGLAGLAWGGIVAFAATAPMNDEWLAVITKLAGFRTAELLGPVVVGPLVEEGVKVAGVVLLGLAMPAGLSSPRTGFVLGALVGIGFGAVEDLTDFTALEAAREDLLGLAILYYGLALNGSAVWVHGLATGLAGAAVGVRAADHRVGRAVGFLAAATLVHGTWNLFSVLSAGLVDSVGPAAFLIGLVVKIAVLVVFAVVIRRLAANERMRADAARASIPER